MSYEAPESCRLPRSPWCPERQEATRQALRHVLITLRNITTLPSSQPSVLPSRKRTGLVNSHPRLWQNLLSLLEMVEPSREDNTLTFHTTNRLHKDLLSQKIKDRLRSSRQRLPSSEDLVTQVVACCLSVVSQMDVSEANSPASPSPLKKDTRSTHVSRRPRQSPAQAALHATFLRVFSPARLRSWLTSTHAPALVTMTCEFLARLVDAQPSWRSTLLLDASKSDLKAGLKEGLKVSPSVLLPTLLALLTRCEPRTELASYGQVTWPSDEAWHLSPSGLTTTTATLEPTSEFGKDRPLTPFTHS